MAAPATTILRPSQTPPSSAPQLQPSQGVTPVSSYIFLGNDGEFYEISITVGSQHVSAPIALWKEHADQLKRIKEISDHILQPGANHTLVLKGNDDPKIYDENGYFVANDTDRQFRTTRDAIITFGNKQQTPNPQGLPAVVGSLSSARSSNTPTPSVASSSPNLDDVMPDLFEGPPTTPSLNPVTLQNGYPDAVFTRTSIKNRPDSETKHDIDHDTDDDLPPVHCTIQPNWEVDLNEPPKKGWNWWPFRKKPQN